MKNKKFDPVKLEIYKNRFQSVAEEMGAALRRTSFSPNIKERLDYSCAVFEADGKMIAQGDNIPVHLGSMPKSVESVIEHLDFNPGDTAILNDPFKGGTHLPDITIVRPVFLGKSKSPSFFVANRAHHADIGGMTPGSMPLSNEIIQEGIIIPPLKIEENGKINQTLMTLLLANVRTPKEREGDLLAQYMSAKVGEARVKEIIDKNGKKEVFEYLGHLQDYSEMMMKNAIKSIPDGKYSFIDYLDNDGQSDIPIKIEVEIRVKGAKVEIDFSNSDSQVPGCVNAVYAITLSAVFYVFRTLIESPVPNNDGCMKPIKLIAPVGSIVNAQYPSAVSGGNVETSQRIVDVLYGALSKALPDKIPAASGGTMNNMTLGGIDPDSGAPFAYYETVANGMGARPTKNGIDGIHTHMTNSLNTPVEVLENTLPIRVKSYKFRKNSGGKGKYNGGDGIEKSIEFLSTASFSVISERRNISPYGLNGGEPGKRGENILFVDGKKQKLPPKVNITVKKGDVFKLLTPGGGGFGC